MKDIQVVQLYKQGFNQEKYGIVGSGFSARHLWSTSKKLVELIKATECPQFTNPIKLSGTKADSWLLVTVKEVQVHMILHDYRYDLDIEFRWLNKPTEAMRAEQKEYDRLKRRSDQINPNEHWWGREQTDDQF